MVRSITRPLALAFCVSLVLCGTVFSGRAPAAEKDKFEVPSVLIRLVEQVEVPATEAGVLTSLKVREGQMVKAEDPLGRVEDDEVRLLLKRAELELELSREKVKDDVDVRIAAKSLEVAKAEEQRALDSQKQYPKSVSQSELDFLRLAVERTKLEIEQARHELELNRSAIRLKESEVEEAKLNVDRRRLSAPIDGMVVQILKHQGEWVEPGTPVVRLVRLDRLRAEGFVEAKSVTDDLVGRPVTLIVTGGAGDNTGRKAAREGDAKSRQTYEGTVVFVSPEIDPVNSQVRLWAEVDNSQLELRPGMRGRLTILPRDTSDVAKAEP